MKRLDRSTSTTLQFCIGACPSCAVFLSGFDNGHTVVYRRSHSSVTMRCETCGLQWTMTWAKVHAAMQRLLAMDLDENSARLYEEMAEMTSIPVRLTPVAERDKALKDHLETTHFFDDRSEDTIVQPAQKARKRREPESADFQGFSNHAQNSQLGSQEDR